MSQVDLKKQSCHPVEFKGQGPLIFHRGSQGARGSASRGVGRKCYRGETLVRGYC